MERMLQKMARQLNAYDEASLISLWDKYATLVERFEPTKRWEDAAIVFSLIQAVRLKNQLFNHHLAAGVEVARSVPLPGMDKATAWLEQVKKNGKLTVRPDSAGSAGGELAVSESSVSKAKKRCKVLSFSRSKGDKPV